MKKKILLLLMALPLAFQGMAQTEDSNVQNIDFEEDTTRTSSLKEIISMQELVYAKNYRTKIIGSVWKRKNFLSLAYASTSLSGKGLNVYTNGAMKEQDTKYKTDWGLSLKRSHTAAFHKKPVAEMLSFGLEYSLLDLSVNHYAEDKDMSYNSNETYPDENVKDDNSYNSNNERHHMPWGSEMYTFAYGVHVGPSITFAPFTKLNNPGLAHIRLQTYFTVGYRVSLLWMNTDSSKDVNQPTNDYSNINEMENFTTVDNSNKLSFGHGFVTTWGIRLNWKGICVGYEIVNGNYSFKSLESKIYGSQKYKFSENSQRISLTYTW